MPEIPIQDEVEATALLAWWQRSPWPSLLFGGLIIAIALAIGTYIREREKLTLEVITERGHVAVVSAIEHGLLEADLDAGLSGHAAPASGGIGRS